MSLQMTASLITVLDACIFQESVPAPNTKPLCRCIRCQASNGTAARDVEISDVCKARKEGRRGKERCEGRKEGLSEVGSE